MNRLLLPVLLLLYLGLWTWAAIAPFDRSDWMLENLLAVVTIAALALSRRRYPLSPLSYILIFVFLCLHAIGSHYTYAEVPYNLWSERLFGVPLNPLLGWERNNFDRVVHFSYGLLLVYPVRELVMQIVGVRGFWGYFVPLDLMVSTSALYELIEWGTAALVGGDLGMAYLGTQGDVWDAHKDMALASLGALLTITATACLQQWKGVRSGRTRRSP